MAFESFQGATLAPRASTSSSSSAGEGAAWFHSRSIPPSQPGKNAGTDAAPVSSRRLSFHYEDEQEDDVYEDLWAPPRRQATQASPKAGPSTSTSYRVSVKRPANIRRASSGLSSVSPARRTSSATKTRSRKTTATSSGSSFWSTTSSSKVQPATLKRWSFVNVRLMGQSNKDTVDKVERNDPMRFMSMLRPSLQPLFVLAVSGIATCTVAFFLIAGFALTALDDLGRNMQLLHSQLTIGSAKARDRIEQDVRVGVAKVFDTAVWATSATGRFSVPSSSASSSRRSSTSMNRDEAASDSGSSTTTGRGRTATSRPSFRRKHQDGARSNPSATSSKRNSFDSIRTTTASSTSSSAPTNDTAWESDEDDVDGAHAPHTTPFTSRPASPSRASKPSHSNAPQFPPRPRLSVLIPSIIFALLFTSFRVFRHLWLQQRAPKASNARR